MTYTPFPVWPAPEGGGGGGPYQTVGVEAVTVDTTLEGPPRTVMAVIEVDGTVTLPAPTPADVGQHWHIATGPYEVTVVGCEDGDVTVPIGMILSVVGAGPAPGRWATVGFKSQNPPPPTDLSASVTYTYVWATDEYVLANGGSTVSGAPRIFIGPNDPAGEGFTLADGDQWEDTTP